MSWKYLGPNCDQPEDLCRLYGEVVVVEKPFLSLYGNILQQHHQQHQHQQQQQLQTLQQRQNRLQQQQEQQKQQQQSPEIMHKEV